MAGDAFTKLKSSVNRGVTAINLMTSASLEKAKIKTHIESISADIQKLTILIGETAYSLWADGESDFSSLNDTFEAIRQKKEEINKLNEEFDQIDARGNQILGTNQVEGVTPVAEEAPKFICPNCGTQYATAVKFCRKCGTKIQ